jgi:hypothetical protein
LGVGIAQSHRAVLIGDLLKSGSFEVAIALDGEAKLAADACELSQRNVAELLGPILALALWARLKSVQASAALNARDLVDGGPKGEAVGRVIMPERRAPTARANGEEEL